MMYKSGDKIRIGDQVLVEKDVPGLVVCDFDAEEYLQGYEDWDPNAELIGGGTLKSGVLIKTDKLGLLHYPKEDADIFLIKR